MAASSAKLATISILDFMNSQGFVSCVKAVRTNSNGYPYITFINDENVAENIYFSKNASKLVEAGDTIAKGFFAPFMAAKTTNAEGQKRWKIISQGESNRVSIEDLF